MTRLTSLSLRRVALVALAVALAAPAALAQDADRRARHLDRLSDALDLSDAQRALVAEAAEPERGALWNVAAALAPTLTDAQKERLFVRPQRADHRDRAERRDARRDGREGAMRAALNLTDEQAAQLDALREARRAERMQARPAPGEVPAELAAILTPEQEEVVAVHRALAARALHAARRARAGRR